MNRLRSMLLGSGRLPAELGAELALEDLRLLAEGLPGTITVRGRRPALRRALVRTEPISGAIAVTGRRLVVWAGRSKHIDVPLRHPLAAALEVSVDGAEQVRFAYDAAAFDPARSGRVELRLRTPQAARVAELFSAGR